MKKILCLIAIIFSFSLTSCTANKITIDEIHQEADEHYGIDYTKAYEQASLSTCVVYDNVLNNIHTGVCISQQDNSYYIITANDFTLRDSTTVYYNDVPYSVDSIHTDVENNLALIQFTTTDTISLKPAEKSEEEVVRGLPIMALTIYYTGNVETNPLFSYYFNKGIISYVDDTRVSSDVANNTVSVGSGIFDTKGCLIGVINEEFTAPSDNSGDYYQGISNALPTDIIQDITLDLTSGSITSRPLFGMTVATVNQDILDESDISISLPDNDFYILVNSVTENGNVGVAGLKAGDIIISINDFKISSLSSLTKFSKTVMANDVLSISYGRMNAGVLEINTISVLMK